MQITSLKLKQTSFNRVGDFKRNAEINFTSSDYAEFSYRKSVACDYMKVFKTGNKDVLRKINKLNPLQFKMLQEALDMIKSSEDTYNPFFVFSQKLQCGAGYQDVAQKTFKTKGNGRVILEISFDENKVPRMSRTENYDGKTISWLRNASKTLIAEKKFNEDEGVYELEHQFEILNNQQGQPYKLIYSKRNDKLPEFLETYEYELANYDENLDLISAIKEGKISDGKKIRTIRHFENSCDILEELFQDDTLTKRTYFQSLDENGDVIKKEYSYKIYDYLGYEKLDIKRTFEKNSDGTTTTTVGNKKYIASFDDEGKIITITDKKNKSIELDAKSYRSLLNSLPLYNFLKTLPADLLIQLYNCDVREIKITNNSSSSYIAPCANGIGFKMELGDLSEETFAHEIGHIVDYSNYDKLLENQDIKDMYNAEWEVFLESTPCIIEKDLKYFSQKSSAKGIGILNRPAKDDGGLREMIAEVNMLTKTFGLESSTAKRASALVQYFPNTIALIANELEASTLI